MLLATQGGDGFAPHESMELPISSHSPCPCGRRLFGWDLERGFAAQTGREADGGAGPRRRHSATERGEPGGRSARFQRSGGRRQRQRRGAGAGAVRSHAGGPAAGVEERRRRVAPVVEPRAVPVEGGRRRTRWRWRRHPVGADAGNPRGRQAQLRL